MTSPKEDKQKMAPLACSVSTVCKLLEISRATAYRLMREEKLLFKETGFGRRVEMSEIQRYLSSLK